MNASSTCARRRGAAPRSDGGCGASRRRGGCDEARRGVVRAPPDCVISWHFHEGFALRCCAPACVFAINASLTCARGGAARPRGQAAGAVRRGGAVGATRPGEVLLNVQICSLLCCFPRHTFNLIAWLCARMVLRILLLPLQVLPCTFEILASMTETKHIDSSLDWAFINDKTRYFIRQTNHKTTQFPAPHCTTHLVWIVVFAHLFTTSHISNFHLPSSPALTS